MTTYCTYVIIHTMSEANYQRNYYKNHTAEVKANQKRYYERNRKKICKKNKTYQKSYYVKNLELIRKRKHEHYLKNRTRILDRTKKRAKELARIAKHCKLNHSEVNIHGFSLN